MLLSARETREKQEFHLMSSNFGRFEGDLVFASALLHLRVYFRLRCSGSRRSNLVANWCWKWHSLKFWNTSSTIDHQQNLRSTTTRRVSSLESLRFSNFTWTWIAYKRDGSQNELLLQKTLKNFQKRRDLLALRLQQTFLKIPRPVSVHSTGQIKVFMRNRMLSLKYRAYLNLCLVQSSPQHPFHAWQLRV